MSVIFICFVKCCKCVVQVVCDEGLVVVCDLLLSEGFVVVMVVNVGKCIGMLYINVIYYFGLVGELCGVLMELMVCDLIIVFDDVVVNVCSDIIVLVKLIDQVFDVFVNGGVGQFVVWIVFSGEIQYFELVCVVVCVFVDVIGECIFGYEFWVCVVVLLLVMCVFGDVVIGLYIWLMFDEFDDVMCMIMMWMLVSFVMG